METLSTFLVVLFAWSVVGAIYTAHKLKDWDYVEISQIVMYTVAWPIFFFCEELRDCVEGFLNTKIKNPFKR